MLNLLVVVVVVVVKAAGTKFLKVALPNGVLSQPPVIQFQRFSTICHNRALIEGGIAGTLMILGLLSGFSVYVDKGVIWDLSMLWACCLVW